MHDCLVEVPPSGSSLVHFEYLSLMKLPSTNVTMKMVGYMYKGKHWLDITSFFEKFHLGMALFTKTYAALLVAFYAWSCHLRK